MVKIIKKSIPLFFLLIFISLLPLSLVGCSKGKTYGEENGTYGTVDMIVQLGITPTNLSSAVSDIYDDTLIITSSLIATQGHERIDIRDYEELKGKTIYTSDDTVEVHYSVITTKWFYYLSLVLSDVSLAEALAVDASSPFYQQIREDEYCMEKLNLDWFSYVVEEDTPHKGKTWREVYKTCDKVSDMTDEPDVWGTDSDGKTVVWDASLRTKNPDVWSICNDYYGCLRMAALQRYGIFSFDGYRGVGKLEVTIPYEKTTNGKTIIEYKHIPLQVVGYIETEADKLLSTGVSMDKNSDEYKTVIEQLQNPVFYSLCGNFLESEEE